MAGRLRLSKEHGLWKGTYESDDATSTVPGKGAEAAGSATAEWNRRIDEKVKRGIPRHLATQQVAKEDEELRAAFVAESAAEAQASKLERRKG